MSISLIKISSKKDLKQLFDNLKVDPYGIEIMLPKSISFLIKISSISCIAANILKQEMLSLGGDVALPRDVLIGKIKKTDCVLIATLSQINRLTEKLVKQPFGLKGLAQDLTVVIENYQKDSFEVVLKNKKLLLDTPKIMGIVNVTDDSFSGDGVLTKDLRKIEDYVFKLIEDGADIIDIGGESTRPNAKKISLSEELNRTIPIIKAIAKKVKVPISIDTYKPEVAKQALDNGAHLVNDISGLRNDQMRKIVALNKAGVVIMHMQGVPENMQKNPVYKNVVLEINEFLAKSVSDALNSGISKKSIIIDPGIGFGKKLEHNIEILRRLSEFKILGCPILVGTSRKSFIGQILDCSVDNRLVGTLASCLHSVKNGAKILRVHDVKEIKQALTVYNSLEIRELN